jgi:hypothetical protein
LVGVGECVGADRPRLHHRDRLTRRQRREDGDVVGLVCDVEIDEARCDVGDDRSHGARRQRAVDERRFGERHLAQLACHLHRRAGIARRQARCLLEERLRRCRLRRLVQLERIELADRAQRLCQQQLAQTENLGEVVGNGAHVEALDHLAQFADGRTQHAGDRTHVRSPLQQIGQ